MSGMDPVIFKRGFPTQKKKGVPTIFHHSNALIFLKKKGGEGVATHRILPLDLSLNVVLQLFSML